MAWVSLALASTAADADALSDALMDLGALSASIEDMHAGTSAEEPLFGEPGMPQSPLWGDCKVVALLADDCDVDAFLATVQADRGWSRLPHIETGRVEDTDWVRLSQSQFEPIDISPRLRITPTWHAVPETGGVNLLLDPGLAFGTGSHPTTRLCLEWLDQCLPVEATLLDYGCGSGILAIAAKKLGAQRVEGVDIDAQAVKASIENAQLNAVEVRFELSDALPAGEYDVVVANILTNPLKALAPLLANRVRVGGQLILSGILTEQAEDVMAAYRPWLALRLWASRDGWACLLGTR